MMSQMRRIVTGIGPDGRSCIVQIGEAPVVARVEGENGFEISLTDLWRTKPPATLDAPPPQLTPSGVDLETPPGASRWMVVEFAPGRYSPMHSTPTVDYDFLVSGELVLELEDGEIALLPGDAVVIPGVAHAWRTHEQGAVLLVALIGTIPQA